jgi:hypothetical protein
MEMGEFRYPVYTLDSKADLNYGEAQACFAFVHKLKNPTQALLA